VAESSVVAIVENKVTARSHVTTRLPENSDPAIVYAIPPVTDSGDGEPAEVRKHQAMLTMDQQSTCGTPQIIQKRACSIVRIRSGLASSAGCT
jgi:hypothetical protein